MGGGGTEVRGGGNRRKSNVRKGVVHLKNVLFLCGWERERNMRKWERIWKIEKITYKTVMKHYLNICVKKCGQKIVDRYIYIFFFKSKTHFNNMKPANYIRISKYIKWNFKQYINMKCFHFVLYCKWRFTYRQSSRNIKKRFRLVIAMKKVDI